MFTRLILLAFSAAVLLATPSLAQHGGFVRTERLGLPVLLDGSGSFMASTNGILGTTRGPDRSAIPGAHLQLRSLRGGQIAERTLSDGTGRFAFRSLEPSTYVVEMTIDDRSVVALSEAVTIGSNEIVQTMVQVTSRTRPFGWWLGSTTSSTLSSASSHGVLAVDPGTSVSPGS